MVRSSLRHVTIHRHADHFRMMDGFLFRLNCPVSPCHHPMPSGAILPASAARLLGLSTRSAYPSRLIPMILTISKICVPLKVSAHSLSTALASCRSLVESLVAISIWLEPTPGPDKDGSTGTANSVSSSIIRSISSRFLSSADAGGSDPVIAASVSSHFARRTAHSKLHTAEEENRQQSNPHETTIYCFQYK